MEKEQNLTNVLESILFVAGEPVDIFDISNKLGISKKQFSEALQNLKERYSGESGILLLEFSGKIQFSTNSNYSTDVSVVLNPIRERQLTRATLETLSIIAYKQPVTRLEIEEVRGVSSDYAIGILLEHKLIEIVGRKDAVGKPVLFGTTDEFLRRFNLSSKQDLPSYDDLISRIKMIRKTDRDERLFTEYIAEEEPEDSDEITALKEIKKKAEKLSNQNNEISANYLKNEDDEIL